jgi:hypothetical protein
VLKNVRCIPEVSVVRPEDSCPHPPTKVGRQRALARPRREPEGTIFAPPVARRRCEFLFGAVVKEYARRPGNGRLTHASMAMCSPPTIFTASLAVEVAPETQNPTEHPRRP